MSGIPNEELLITTVNISNLKFIIVILIGMNNDFYETFISMRNLIGRLLLVFFTNLLNFEMILKMG